MRSEVAAATHCANCNQQDHTTRLRHVAESSSDAQERRFLCGSCAGGMVTMGCTVTPYTPTDAAQFGAMLDGVAKSSRHSLVDPLPGVEWDR